MCVENNEDESEDIKDEAEENVPVGIDFQQWLDFVAIDEGLAIERGINEEEIMEEVREEMGQSNDQVEEEDNEEKVPTNKEVAAAAAILEKMFKHHGSHQLVHLLKQEVQKVQLENVKQATLENYFSVK